MVITSPIREKTSIIIPVLNQLRYTKMCLENIFRYTNGDFEIIVVNNGSKDGTKEYLEQNQKTRSIHNQENLGFARAINQGISMATGEYIVVLNNDCLVSEEWLERMIWVAQEEKIGVVGVMSNFVGSSQLIEADIKKLEAIPQFAQKVCLEKHHCFFYVKRVAGLCMLIKKEVIDKIGGFDPRFGIGSFEDDDFCLRALLSGYKNAIAQDVFVYHFGSVTFRAEKIDKGAIFKENWEKFKTKWKLPFEMSIQEMPVSEELYIPIE